MKKIISIAIICLLLIAYPIFSYIFKLSSYSIYNLIINPLSYMFILFITSLLFDGLSENIRDKKAKHKTMFIITMLYLILYFGFGLITGFKYNAYSQAPLAIIKNIISFISVIVIKEFIRFILVKNAPKKKIIYFIIILVFTFIELNLTSNMFAKPQLFELILGKIVPIFIKQLIFTYILLKYGYTSVLINRVTIEMAYILSPILPNIEWYILSVFDIAYCYIIYLIIKYESKILAKIEDNRRNKKLNPFVTIVLVILILIVLLFQAGIFKYQPIAIMSDSMKPAFSRGDAVVIKKIDKKSIRKLQEDDIIEYIYDKHIVVHRIVKIFYVNDKLFIRTKGDNNKDVDFELVTEEQILGVAEFKIPYIGYPTVFLSELFDDEDKPDIEMGQ